MTTDTKSAAAFFTKVVGWKTQASTQIPSYTMFMTKGRGAAGLMAMTEEVKAMGAPPHWLSYIATPDVDRTIAQATTLGAKVLKPAADIPTVGRFGVLQDPQGAVFAVFTAAPGGMPPDGGAGLGEYVWHELMTTDRAGAFSFYQSLFGWQDAGSMDMGPQGTYQQFGLDGKAFGGMFRPAQMPGPPVWLPYVSVADVTKAAAAIKRLGGTVINGPMPIPGGDMIVQALDGQGVMFALHASKQVAAAQPSGNTARPAPQKTAKAAPQKIAKAAPQKITRAARAAVKASSKKTKFNKTTARTRPARRKTGPKAAARKATRRRSAGRRPSGRRRSR
jgi:predicted enzyme related to lactoylglutathione lyase